MKPPKTLLEATRYFSDYDNCHEFLIELRWPDGKVRCPHCGSDDVAYLPNARVFKCYQKPLQKFSLKVGTIFEDSPIALEKWLPVMWMVVNCKNGVSSWEIRRAIGVTQKTAWFMLQRCRLAMQGDNGGKLDGEVEVDETFIGGAARFMHTDRRKKVITERGVKDKTAVFGMLERGGEVRAAVVPFRRKHHLQKEIRAHVAAKTAIYSDALLSYQGLNHYNDYTHQVIDHAERYVDGQVHTNGLENFWSLLKRGLKGTYIAIEPFHLFRYIDEQAFRFNERFGNDGERFEGVMKQIVNKRLTYKDLTGKTAGSETSESQPS